MLPRKESCYFIVASRTDTFTGRWVAWKSSGVDDYLLFPYRTIKNAPRDSIVTSLSAAKSITSLIVGAESGYMGQK